MEFYDVFIYPFLMNLYFNCKKYFKDKSNYLLSKQDNIMIQTSTQSNFIQNQLNADFLSSSERDLQNQLVGSLGRQSASSQYLQNRLNDSLGCPFGYLQTCQKNKETHNLTNKEKKWVKF